MAGSPAPGHCGGRAQAWDLVLTVCDHARDACPVLPGAPVTAHWGQEDPAAVEGATAGRRQAFQEALLLLEWRVGQLLALPLDPAGIKSVLPRVQEIGRMVPGSASSGL
jgi:arsenate reductase